MIRAHELAFLAAALVAAVALPAAAQSSPATRPNRLSAAERADGWKLLFDGRTLKGWRGLGYDSVPTAHWKVVDGAIMKVASGSIPKMPDGQPASGGDLMTKDAYADFELRFEWKVTPGANSGVKYNVSEAMSRKSANHAALGFEYQVLDDSLHEDNKIPSHRSASLYDMIPSGADRLIRPVGMWNSARIVFRGKRGEHWVNNVRVVSFELSTPRMDSLLAASKYRAIAGFADRRTGHIVLQDHGDATFFRNLKIREFTHD